MSFQVQIKSDGFFGLFAGLQQLSNFESNSELIVSRMPVVLFQQLVDVLFSFIELWRIDP